MKRDWPNIIKKSEIRDINMPSVNNKYQSRSLENEVPFSLARIASERTVMWTCRTFSRTIKKNLFKTLRESNLKN